MNNSKIIKTITKAGTIECITGNYKYNGTDIPSPSSVECEYHILNRAWNDGLGNEHTVYIGTKRAVTHHYKNVSVETFNKIKDMLNIENGNQHILLTTQFDGYEGTIDMWVRVGSPIKTTQVFSEYGRRIVNFDLHFVEPEVKKNSELGLNPEIYNNENIKAIFYFDNDMKYEVSLYDNSDEKFITYFRKRQPRSISYNSFFGSIASNKLNLSIFDANNYLDINNTDSPYFDYMRHGVKIELQIEDIENNTYVPFGTYYVTKWSNSFYDGLQDVTPIEAEDELTYILDSDMPKLPAYSGVKAIKLISDVLVGCGVDKNRIKIDTSLDYELPFGTTEDDKVGYFLNSICTALCAVMVINDNNDVLIYSALRGYGKNWNIFELPIKVTGRNNIKSTYDGVKVTYDKAVGREVGTILDTVINIEGQVTEIEGLGFNNKMLSVLEISAEKDDVDAEILDFQAYQNGIDLKVKCNKSIDELDLHIIGEKILTTKKYVTSDIEFSDRKHGRYARLNIYNEYISKDEDAQVIANLYAEYIANMDRIIQIETVYNAKVQDGDIFNINNELLKGFYLVIDVDTIIKDGDYISVITLMPLNKSIVWDDSKVWDDGIQWLDNKEISQM